MENLQMTKEKLQEMTLDFWINEGVYFSKKMYSEGKLDLLTFWLETGQYTSEEWMEKGELLPWAKELLEDEQKMLKELEFSEGEVTIVSETK